MDIICQVLVVYNVQVNVRLVKMVLLVQVVKFNRVENLICLVNVKVVILKIMEFAMNVIVTVKLAKIVVLNVQVVMMEDIMNKIWVVNLVI